MRFSVSFPKRLLLLFCAVVVCLFIFSLFSGFAVMKFGLDSTPAMRIITVVQDLMIFILPAIVTAVVVTRQPAELLAVDRKPALMPLLFALCVMIVSLPAMNMVIWLNQNVTFPDAIASLMKQMEDSAEQLIKVMQGPHTVPNLIMSILIVGVLAGFSEELIFRGAFQRIMSTGGVNAHLAIWIAAFVFSVVHMQFYGFVPRLLLGAFFGYLLYWTGSLWIPILMHIFNNSVYLVSSWLCDGERTPIDEIGFGDNYIMVGISVVLTAIALRMTWLSAKKAPKNDELR